MRLVQHDDNEWIFDDPAITFEVEEELEAALEADDQGDSKTADRIALNVVRKCPNHIDALHHLSLWYDERGDAPAAYVFCQAAVAIGLHAIPRYFDWTKAMFLGTILRTALSCAHTTLWRSTGSNSGPGTTPL